MYMYMYMYNGLVMLSYSLHYNPRAVIKTGEKPLTADELKMLVGDEETIRAIKRQYQRWVIQHLASFVNLTSTFTFIHVCL